MVEAIFFHRAFAQRPDCHLDVSMMILFPVHARSDIATSPAT